MALCFTYSVPKFLRLANTCTGRDVIAFEDKSLSKLATHCVNTCSNEHNFLMRHLLKFRYIISTEPMEARCASVKCFE